MAIEDLSSDNEYVRETAIRWFLNQDIFINTFRGVCFTLDFNPEQMCIKILKTYAKKKDLQKFRNLISTSSLTKDSVFNYPDISH